MASWHIIWITLILLVNGINFIQMNHVNAGLGNLTHWAWFQPQRHIDIDGLEQDYSISSVLAMEILQSCTRYIVLQCCKKLILWHLIKKLYINHNWLTHHSMMTTYQHRSGSTLAQVMALVLNQSWLIISKIQCHLLDGNFTRDMSAINH